MATVKVSLTRPAGRASGAPVSAPRSGARAVTVETTGSSEVVGSLSARAGELWILTCSGGAVDVAFGLPAGLEAGPSTGFRMLDGETRPYVADVEGEVCAVMDVA